MCTGSPWEAGKENETREHFDVNFRFRRAAERGIALAARCSISLWSEIWTSFQAHRQSPDGPCCGRTENVGQIQMLQCWNDGGTPKEFLWPYEVPPGMWDSPQVRPVHPTERAARCRSLGTQRCCHAALGRCAEWDAWLLLKNWESDVSWAYFFILPASKNSPWSRLVYKCWNSISSVYTCYINSIFFHVCHHKLLPEHHQTLAFLVFFLNCRCSLKIEVSETSPLLLFRFSGRYHFPEWIWMEGHLFGKVEMGLVCSGGPSSVGYHHPKHHLLESDWKGDQTPKTSRNNSNNTLMDYCEVLKCKTDSNITVRAQLFLDNLSAAFKSVTTSSF